MAAILFGSISTLVDTSERQRDAFNRAFAEHGLDWRWEVQDYRERLQGNGGRDRIADYAREQGVEVDADAIHATKSRLFQEELRADPPALREGVLDTVRVAREHGWKVGLVTTTTPENVVALLAAIGDDLPRDRFDVVVDLTQVARTKPAPDAYVFALQALDEQADACVAVEDNVGGLASATAAGIRVVAFPNANTAGHDFGDARRVDRVDFDDLAGDSVATAGA